MRRFLFVPWLCCLGLALARPADAWIIRWIDDLSGPGPFKGVEFEWQVVCLGDPPPPASPTGAKQEFEPDKEGLRAAAAVVVGLLGPTCIVDRVPPGRTRRASFNLGVGLYASYRNELPFDDLPADPKHPDKEVKLTTLQPSFQVRLFRGVDIGAGGGAMWFSGPRFTSFRRAFLEPLRVDVRPALFRWSDKKCTSAGEPCWQRTPVVRFSYFVVPAGFNAVDFGARPGSFNVPRDKIFTVAAVIDLEPLYTFLKNDLDDGGAAQAKP